MITGLVITLIIIFVFPLLFEKVESNLEIFLLVLGICSNIIAGTMHLALMKSIFTNKFIYIITAAVLIAGFVFNHYRSKIVKNFNAIQKKVSLKIIVFFLIVGLGLLSSVITAIIASLILVEFLYFIPLERKSKIKISIIACYSIGLGAALTPIGEPLATIIISKLHAHFGYIFAQIGIYIVPCIILLGILGMLFTKTGEKFNSESEIVSNEESNKDIIVRGIKIFIFVIALELLGEGFKPLIDKYILSLDSRIIYWVNMLSAVLDNATMASAEISAKMTAEQIKAILMGLLISGGMMIPGNIPNIVCAGKLKIKSNEWIKFGVPLGLCLLIIYYIVLFI